MCGAEGVVRGECCRCQLKVKVTGQKDGQGGGGGREINRYDRKGNQ